MTNRHHTPVTEVAPVPSVVDTTWRKPAGRTLTEAQVHAIVEEAVETVKRLQAQQIIEAKVERVVNAVEAVVTEALAMPLSERSEAERRRIEGDLWTVAEMIRNPGGRPPSPFWSGFEAA